MGGRRYYYPPVTDEDTEVQRRQAPVRGYYTATGGRRLEAGLQGRCAHGQPALAWARLSTTTVSSSVKRE